MRNFPDITSRRLLWAFVLSFFAFVLWLVPSYIVMSPDSNYAARVTREAELVAAAIARGAMARTPSSKIGDPKDPRIIAAKKRSPFHKNRAEGVMRQMQDIIHKRIVLYDHRRRITLDSQNFDLDKKVEVDIIPDLTKNPNEKAKPFPRPNTLPPPRGNSELVLAALGGQSVAREIKPRRRSSRGREEPAQKSFQPRQSFLLVAAPVRRLKLVQGAVVLIDHNIQERALWRWRALWVDNLSVFGAILVALLLLLLWIRSTFVTPLSRLAYSAQGAKTKYNDAFSMLNHRQELGQLAARNFTSSTQFFKRFISKIETKKEKNELADSQMAALMHNALIDAKLEVENLALIVQRVLQRQNAREQNFYMRKMHSTKQGETLPYKNKVQLKEMSSNNYHNPWQLPLFEKSLELCLDYFIQAASLAQNSIWRASVRVSLVRHRKRIDIIIEDDGEDVPAPTLNDWLARGLDKDAAQTKWTQAAVRKIIEMHLGKISIPSLRPPRLKLSLPLSPNDKNGDE